MGFEEYSRGIDLVYLGFWNTSLCLLALVGLAGWLVGWLAKKNTIRIWYRPGSFSRWVRDG